MIYASDEGYAMGTRPVLLGSASLYLASGVSFLDQEESVFSGMIDGWSDLQLGSKLNQQKSVDTNLARVKAFRTYTNEVPWNWTSAMFDEWMVHLVSVRHLLPSTIRAYQTSIRTFCEYICAREYTWVAECETRFGTHPIQVCHEWNNVKHVEGVEGRPGRRPLSRDEVQQFLDHIDGTFTRRLEDGKKGALQVYRDATLFKVMYAWGLRANEAATLDLTDFYRNPKAPEFGEFGILHVRNGKGSRGSGPKQRAVVTLREDAVEALRDYIENVHPLVKLPDSKALWVSEKGTRMKGRDVADRFAIYRDELGLDTDLTPHCLRHSYATHLTEEGFDPKFIQNQLGHAFGTTTGIYTHISGDYANVMMRDALNRRRGNDKKRDTAS